MASILQQIARARRSIAVLVDPEKTGVDAISAFAKAVHLKFQLLTKDLELDFCCILVGGSTMEGVDLHNWLRTLQTSVDVPVILFPGSADQITEEADGLLFLNLISGRNPAYLIEQQVAAAAQLKETKLEVIPTGYILVDGGQKSAVERVTGTIPMDQIDVKGISDTAYAGQLMGNRLIYLEAGSGALQPVAEQAIKKVREDIKIPIIVGGGLRNLDQLQKAFKAGASMLVVGTAIEEDLDWKP